ncbi:hypothetical protein B0H15DRAFT_1002213 [Mycena belliarum]|uniref:Uncharacterized protein n=1 Tax=Mycena belliarum TaxID=1033014 RepID=A0AAD6UG83_9AGAR|nr:hypothetical protein B0H15DRAFT_1002213 [Mycena belliae]
MGGALRSGFRRGQARDWTHIYDDALRPSDLTHSVSPRRCCPRSGCALRHLDHWRKLDTLRPSQIAASFHREPPSSRRHRRALSGPIAPCCRLGQYPSISGSPAHTALDLGPTELAPNGHHLHPSAAALFVAGTGHVLRRLSNPPLTPGSRSPRIAPKSCRLTDAPRSSGL